jgi:hypothetical protein
LKPIDPNLVHIKDPGILRWAQSIFKVLTNNTTLAEGNLIDSTGVYTTFNVDNGNGIMFRVGASSSSLPNKWDAGTSQVDLNHALGRIPIGFIVCDLDANAIIWRATASTTGNMLLQTNNNACNATVYIF